MPFRLRDRLRTTEDQGFRRASLPPTRPRGGWQRRDVDATPAPTRRGEAVCTGWFTETSAAPSGTAAGLVSGTVAGPRLHARPPRASKPFGCQSITAPQGQENRHEHLSLVGNLTRYPELRSTPDGTAIYELRIAVDAVGDTPPLYLDVADFRASAESCARHLAKGREIAFKRASACR